MILPTFKHEQKLWAQGYRYVVGLDEVGRGAWAGPLVAAAVIFPPQKSRLGKVGPLEWRDSKLLSPLQREKLVPLIKGQALAWAVASVSVRIINTHGVAHATELAMLTALDKLRSPVDFHLIDFFTLKSLPADRQQGIKHGDTLVASIAAASVIAKVHRDSLMTKLHQKYPHYGWADNKGYGTAFHQEALRHHGPCPWHRHAFLPTKLRS